MSLEVESWCDVLTDTSLTKSDLFNRWLCIQTVYNRRAGNSYAWLCRSLHKAWADQMMIVVNITAKFLHESAWICVNLYESALSCTNKCESVSLCELSIITQPSLSSIIEYVSSVKLDLWISCKIIESHKMLPDNFGLRVSLITILKWSKPA